MTFRPILRAQPYRVSGLLATSMFKGVSRGFLEMEDRIPKDRPKVIYKVMLCVDHEGGIDDSLKPRHLAFIDKTEVHARVAR